MKIKQLAVGSILSEIQFYKVKELQKDCVIVVDDNGNEVTIGDKYVEQVLTSADIFDKEEKKTMTELAELFINSPRIAMTVCFMKKDTAKTQKAYKAEVAAAINEVQSAPVSKVEGLLTKLIENPISKVIPGGERVMKGRHYGNVDDLGRVHFVDMELAKGTGDTDIRLRQVDPRTIQYLIIGGIKYSLK